MNEPSVSVVMVVCNAVRFLAESIESILAQTFREFEFIIVDFGSTDRSPEIISGYEAADFRIRFHKIPHCEIAEARNTACGLAKGKYLAVMDADDVSLPDRLRWEIELMEQHPEVGLLGGATEWIDARGMSLRINHFPVSNDEIRAALAVRCPFCQPAVLIRRKAFELVGGYRKVFAQAEDYDLWLRISEHFKCANLKQVVLKYRIHPHQISMRKRQQQTLCVLAAQVSQSSRRSGLADPLDSTEEITGEKLYEWGVTYKVQQRQIATDWRNWIRHMRIAGEYAVALQAAFELLGSDLRHVDRRQISDLHLTVAWLYWKEKRFLKSWLAFCKAVVTRPVLLGRPLKPWLRHTPVD